jgi:DNA-binding LacI/PurR family transcriptional regulator
MKTRNVKVGKRVTISDIAFRAGVAKSTVSFVLNEKGTQVPISEETRKKVLRAIHECGYQPNAAARALSTRRTGQIGFILSDTIADGLANIYYANCLAGVEKACRRRGYGLNVSLYNLSNLDSFVFPQKVGQRAVDGLILGDYVQTGVLARFNEFEIPLVCIGDDVERGEKVPAVVGNCFEHMWIALRHLVRLGHRNVGIHTPTRQRAEDYFNEFARQVAADVQYANCRITPLYTPRIGADYDAAGPLMDAWQALKPEDRPTGIYGNYQTILAFQKEMKGRGLKCPQDISLISGLDTIFCGLTEPGITSIRQDMEGVGQMAANLLIDHIENIRPLESKTYPADLSSELVERESCGPPMK